MTSKTNVYGPDQRLLTLGGKMYLASADLEAGPGSRPRWAAVESAYFRADFTDRDVMQIYPIFDIENFGGAGK